MSGRSKASMLVLVILAQKWTATLLLLQEKLDKAVETVRKAVPDVHLTVRLVDLGCFESVR